MTHLIEHPGRLSFKLSSTKNEIKMLTKNINAVPGFMMSHQDIL